MGGLDGGSGVEPWEYSLFRADSKKTNTDWGKLEGETPTMEKVYNPKCREWVKVVDRDAQWSEQ